MGERPIAELQFADFVSCPFDQIVTVGAKTHWRSGIALPRRDPRCPPAAASAAARSTRRRPRAGSSAWPGLKVVCPGTVDDAYGLLRSGDRGRRPGAVLRAQGALPAAEGRRRPSRHRARRSAAPRVARARHRRHRGDLRLRRRRWRSRWPRSWPRRRRSRCVDLRTIWPSTRDTVLESVARTSRALVLQEASASIGVADALVSLIAREGFALLDAPLGVVAAARHAGAVRARARGRLPAVRRRARAALEELLAY